MATTTTLALGSSLDCQVWATIDCTVAAATLVTGADGPVLACRECAAHVAELAAAAADADGVPF